MSSPQKIRFPRWLLAAIVLPRLALFGAVVSHPDVAVKKDSLDYISLSRNLLHHQIFSSETTPPFSPNTTRTPGYPLFLMPWVGLFSSPIVWIAGIQLILGCVTLYILWRWLSSWNEPKAVAIMTALVGLDWVTLAHTPLVATETIFMLVFTIAFIETWRSLKEEPGRSFGAGLLWGLATLIRPLVLYLPFFLCVLWFRRKKYVVLFLVGSYLFPGLWVARNKIVADYPGLISIDGIALLLYPASGIEAQRTGKSLNEAQRRLLEEAHSTVSETGNVRDVDYQNAYRRRALDVMRAHPWRLFKYCAHGVVRILWGNGFEMLIDYLGLTTQAPDKPQDSALITGAGTLALLKRYPALIPLYILYLLGLTLGYLGMAAGGLLLWRAGARGPSLLLLGTFAYILAISCHQGYYRFRIPLMPLIAIGATVSLDKWSRSTTRRFASST